MKKLLSVMLAVMTFLTACSTKRPEHPVFKFGRWLTKEEKAVVKVFDPLVEALEKKDRELLKSVLSNSALASEDLDTGIDYCFELLEGEDFSVKAAHGITGHTRWDSGNRREWAQNSGVLTVDGKDYLYELVVFMENDWNPDTVGLDSFKLSPYDSAAPCNGLIEKYDRSGVYYPAWDDEVAPSRQ